MKPKEHDLICYKGETFKQPIIFKSNGEPLPLTGMTAKSQVRKRDNDANLVAEFTCTITANEGRVDISLSSATTGALEPDHYVWDLKLTDGNDEVAYYIRGKFIVDGRVTV